MLQKLLQNKAKIGWSLFLILLLILIRAFEDTLFYDPFLNYFKTEYAHLPLPRINIFKLFFKYIKENRDYFRFCVKPNVCTVEREGL